MSARRYIAAATIVIVAVLCTPAMLTPGINSADLIVVAAAPALALVVLWRPRDSKTPSGADVAPLDTESAPEGTDDGLWPEHIEHEKRMNAIAARRGYTR